MLKNKFKIFYFLLIFPTMTLASSVAKKIDYFCEQISNADIVMNITVDTLNPVLEVWVGNLDWSLMGLTRYQGSLWSIDPSASEVTIELKPTEDMNAKNWSLKLPTKFLTGELKTGRVVSVDNNEKFICDRWF